MLPDDRCGTLTPAGEIALRLRAATRQAATRWMQGLLAAPWERASAQNAAEVLDRLGDGQPSSAAARAWLTQHLSSDWEAERRWAALLLDELTEDTR